MSREAPVRFREGLGVQFPRATRLVILCRTRAQAEQALAKVQEIMGLLPCNFIRLRHDWWN